LKCVYPKKTDLSTGDAEAGIRRMGDDIQQYPDKLCRRRWFRGPAETQGSIRQILMTEQY
jgi:hypothetical protein